MTKELIKARMKERMRGVSDKFNLSVYDGELSDENSALLLFGDFLKKSLIGLDFILKNGFCENWTSNEQQVVICNHLYSSSLLYYSKMFRGGKGVKRESVNLKEDALFNRNGEERVNAKIRLDRFYIEEFFSYSEPEFQVHHEILYKVDKSIVHLDKTNLNNSFMFLILDVVGKSNYLGIDNHFEYLMFPERVEIVDIYNVIVKIMAMVNNMISINTGIIHEKLSNEDDYTAYYANLLISEDEL
ncbi:TPA: hypothetical protein ACX6SA_003983 [Photobacterium damselae]